MLKVLDLFRKGQVVANPEAWKKGQVTVMILTLSSVSCSQLQPRIRSVSCQQRLRLTHPQLPPWMHQRQQETYLVETEWFKLDGVEVVTICKF
jgi:hypothetical protein